MLQENLNTFFDRIDSDPTKNGLPLHVKKELRESFQKLGVQRFTEKYSAIGLANHYRNFYYKLIKRENETDQANEKIG